MVFSKLTKVTHIDFRKKDGSEGRATVQKPFAVKFSTPDRRLGPRGTWFYVAI